MLLRFPTSEDRTAFLSRLQDEAPDLYGQAKPSYSQPTVLIVRETSEDDQQRIRSMTAASVKEYADVQFSPT